MRRTIDAFARGLPLDNRSRRVLDETLLDCEYEAAQARTAAARVWVDLRSLVSIARALVFVSLRELPRIPVWWLVSRLAAFGVLPVVVFTLLTPSTDPLQALRIGTVLFTGWLPLAFFYMMAWRPAARSLPVLAVAICAGGLIGSLVLYISPHALWRFYEEGFRNARHPLSRIPLFPNWLTPNWLGFVDVLGPVALTAALVVFAEATRRMSRRRRLILIVLAPCLYAAPFACLSGGLALLTGQAFPVILTSSLIFLGQGPFRLVNAGSQVLLAVALIWWSSRVARPLGNLTATP